MSSATAETLSVVVERDIPFPPEKIWRALTQPHLIEEWLMKGDFKPVVGHGFSFSAEWGAVECQVRAVEPNKTLSYTWGDHNLALLWQILSGAGFPNQFFCDSWVVGLWRGRSWVAGHRIGRRSLDAFSSRSWLDWVTRRGDKCVRSTCRG